MDVQDFAGQLQDPALELPGQVLAHFADGNELDECSGFSFQNQPKEEHAKR